MKRHAAVIAHSTVRGGAEKYLRLLYDGHSIDGDVLDGEVVGHQPDWPARTELNLSRKWTGPRSILTGRMKLPFERRRLAHALDGASFDYAHMQFKREQVGFTGMVARSMPVVWTEHGLMPDRTLRLLGRAYARAASHTAAIVCVSPEVAEQVGSLNDSARIEVVENPVDTSIHTVATESERLVSRAALGVDGDKPLAIWVGRLDENKRPELAAEVGYGWDGTLLIAGDGPKRGLLVDRDGVRALGHVDPARLYSAADVILMTSTGRGEGMPFVLLEAAAHGIPSVVSQSSPLLSRIAAESGGLAVDEADLDAWRRGLDDAIADTAATPECAGVGRTARRRGVETPPPRCH